MAPAPLLMTVNEYFKTPETVLPMELVFGVMRVAEYGVRECWLIHQQDVSVTVIRFEDRRVTSRDVFGRRQRIVSRALPEFSATLNEIFG